MPSVRDRLEALRERLLDLSFRNRLLNHSDFGRRILKIRGVALAELYQLVVEESKAFTVFAAPDAGTSAASESRGEPSTSGITPEPFEDHGIDLAAWLQRRRLPIGVAQHVVLPLHMGAFPACAAAILKTYGISEIHDGDAFITNHPYLGGSPHAPDMGVLTPIFYKGHWVGFAANMAHKSDIGGTVPGSGSGNAREIFQEGLHLPPVKFMSQLRPVKEIEAVIMANSRTPALVIGDLRGQVGAARLGERRIS